MLGCAAQHPLASVDVERAADLASFPYVDRLRCEFRDRIQEHFFRQEILMRPRFRAEREDWVQRVVADGHAICIL
ncbi:LysR family transcriptional regulator, partial [Acinetobacter baumannii]